MSASFGPIFGLRFAGADDILRFIFELAVVAIGQSIHVQAHHFATAGHEINAIAFNSRRGEQAEIFPVVDFAGSEFRHDQLPEKFAGLFVEAHEDAAVALMLRVARILVVRADENLAAGDSRIAVTLRTELCDPLHVLGRGDVDSSVPDFGLPGSNCDRQDLSRANTCCDRSRAAPLRPIFGESQR